MEFSTIVSVLSTTGLILGGLWTVGSALLSHYFKQKEVTDRLQASAVERSIASLREVAQDHTAQLKSLEREMNAKFLEFSEKLIKTSVEMNNYAKEMHDIRSVMLSESKGFHELISRLGPENTDELPGGYVRVKDRKP